MPTPSITPSSDSQAKLVPSKNKWKKYLRGDVPLEEILPLIIEEAGDVLWYWARLCLEAGQSGDMVAQANLQKLIDRKERGVLQGFGSHR
jgi:NTP pyrophosphatase (non-canonical NTP hydrolase)